MAALDSFRAFNNALSSEKRKTASEFIARATREFLAARSEDARKRLLEKYLNDIQVPTT